MLEVNVREARQSLSRLLDQVEAGHEVQIVRKGKVIARLVPDVVTPDLNQVLQDSLSLREAITKQFGQRDNPVLSERQEARY